MYTCDCQWFAFLALSVPLLLLSVIWTFYHKCTQTQKGTHTKMISQSQEMCHTNEGMTSGFWVRSLSWLLFCSPTAWGDDDVITEKLFMLASFLVSHCWISPTYACVNIEFPSITPLYYHGDDSMKALGDHVQLARWWCGAEVFTSLCD